MNYKGYRIEKDATPVCDGYDYCYEHNIYDANGVWQGSAYSFCEARWMIDNGKTLDQFRA